MKKANKCLTVIFIVIFLTGCYNVKRTTKNISTDKNQYGWYVGTVNSHFFIVKRSGFLKKNLAFRLPEYPYSCIPKTRSDSFFVHSLNKRVSNKKYFILGNRDSSSFGQNVIICKAKGICKEIDSMNLGDPQKKGEKVVYRIRVSDGYFSIKALWIETFVSIDNLILFSNANNDSLEFRGCK